MTKKNYVYLTLAVSLFLGSSLHIQGEDKGDDVPVAPIESTAFAGFTNALQLANDQLHIVIVPAIGRIIHVGPSATNNMLHFNKNLAGKLPPEEDDGQWLNYGGDWLWPVAQSRWPDFQEGEWPPSRLLDGMPWDGRAWKCADGTLSCLLTREFGAPLHVKVSRLIKLPPDQDHFSIHQRMERVKKSTVPMTLWNISQIYQAERVVIPLDEDSAFGKGYQPMMFDPPASNAVFETTACVVYKTADGKESKLCSDSKKSWIAAQRGSWVILEQIDKPITDGVFPDGGCTIEMYSNAGLGYAEIENLSIEKILKVGESIENTIHVTLRKLKNETQTDKALSDTILQWTTTTQ